mmetsp:Transcript_100843/g.291609  ORF Transcript_100843/g.291609 Transcript_100843/m.291609 type:complete len:295 (+) Transcript_100843:390-1274(+)
MQMTQAVCLDPARSARSCSAAFNCLCNSMFSMLSASFSIMTAFSCICKWSSSKPPMSRLELVLFCSYKALYWTLCCSSACILACMSRISVSMSLLRRRRCSTFFLRYAFSCSRSQAALPMTAAPVGTPFGDGVAATGTTAAGAKTGSSGAGAAVHELPPWPHVPHGASSFVACFCTMPGICSPPWLSFVCTRRMHGVDGRPSASGLDARLRCSCGSAGPPNDGSGRTAQNGAPKRQLPPPPPATSREAAVRLPRIGSLAVAMLPRTAASEPNGNCGGVGNECRSELSMAGDGVS